MRIHRLALLVLTLTLALTLLLWSKNHLRPSSRHQIRTSSPPAKECLKVNARCNVYNGDSCCGTLYCHELPSMGATCVPPGASEYYRELLPDGWLVEDEEGGE
ncbi:hypothetical protein IMSHALPRED_002043 [Imshaugia aleurites]|uniref:Uncharacterized protein n=1 Tax=Imshaugia aleurites TaxID=172621 RepID=A0A8H3J4B3_9LECA|nr:hypothetical protein IMSHALPRED_002043 [Imshaugia aleurites]